MTTTSQFQLRLRRNLSILFVYALAMLLFIIVSIAIPGFSGIGNIRNLSVQIVILAVIAAGQTFAILSGGIDLSIAWLMTVSAVLVAYYAEGRNEALVWVIPLVLAVGAAVGFVNGAGISLLKVPPIIMTLAMSVVLNGAIVLVVGLAPPPKAPTFVENLVHGNVLGIPNPITILTVVTLLITVLLTFTSYGRQLYAVGTSVTVSEFSGVTPAAVLILTYMLSSIAAVCAGILLLGFTGTADLGIGVPYLFPSVVATIVGGASILGGSGHYVGTVAGVILMIVLQALLVLLNLGAGAISVFYGATILLSVWLVSLRTRQRGV